MTAAILPAVAADSRWRQAVRRSLLAWFQQQARVLPWRSDPQPYHVWVSEVMLQQTQVATVIDYYQRFLKKYPTIADLAAADEQELMRLWEGLGYYRRARSLLAASRQIVDQHGGVFPQRYEQVLALPGIGRYTAGAILSISGDQRLPILEGNTVRVFSRWVGLTDDVSTPDARNQLWQIAEAMLPQRRAGTFNQAAMELGALVCKPKSPDCAACPVHSRCQANRWGRQDQIPGKVTKLRYQDQQEFGFVVPLAERARDGARGRDGRRAPAPAVRYLACRVPDGQRWAGLWDVPRWTGGDARSADQAAGYLSEQLGVEIRPDRRLTTIKHAVTKYRITLDVYHAQPVDEADVELAADDYGWFVAEELAELPLSVTGRRIVNLL